MSFFRRTSGTDSRANASSRTQNNRQPVDRPTPRPIGDGLLPRLGASASSSASGRLQQENTELKRELKEAQKEIAKLQSRITELERQARTFRQQDVRGDRPEKAESEEETLFNVCNHPSMNQYFEMEEPRVISEAGKRHLSGSVTIGDSLSLKDIEENLRANHKNLSADEFKKLFPINTQLKRLANDLADGDKKISPTHLECLATMSPFCTAEDGEDAELNKPYIAPDGTTASLGAFESAARHNRGNHSLAQGALSSSAPLTRSELTPNNALEKISQTFNETWALPSSQIRRRESFSANVNYEDRQNDRLAESEMNLQGFGQHKTQMCLIIDKPSFDQNNQQDIDNASRIARKVTQLASKLDDNGSLEVFSNQIGEPIKLDMRQPGNDLKISRSMTRGQNPDPEAHILALLEHFYKGDPSADQYHRKPVFCTLVTKSLSEEKYQLLKNTTNLFSDMKLPFFLKVVNVNPSLPQAEIQRINRLDDKTSNDPDENAIDNVDVVCAKEPGEITPKNFLREYKGFVAEAQSKQFLLGNQGFDTRQVNIHDEGRV